MNYIERIAKGGMIVFAMSVIGIILGYAFRLYISRMLSVEDYGFFYSVLTFVSFISLLCVLGLKESLVKYIPELGVKKNRGGIKSIILYVLILQLAAASIAAFILFFYSDFISMAYFHNIAASLPLKIMSFYIIFSVVIYTFNSVFMGLGKTVYFSSFTWMNNVLIFAAAVVFGVSVIKIPVYYVFASIVLAVISFFMIRRTKVLRARFIWDRDLAKKIGIFALCTLGITVLDSLLSSADTMFLTYFRTLEEVGYYQVALPTAKLVMVFYSSIILIIFPMFSEMWARNEKEKVANVISFILKYMLILLLPFAMLTVAFPDVIIRILFSSKYLPAAPALQILAFSPIFLSLCYIINAAFASIGKLKEAACLMIAITASNIILNLMLTPVFGIIGASSSLSLASFLGFVLSLQIIRRKTSVSFRLVDSFKIIIVSVAMLLFIYEIKNILVMDAWAELAITMVISVPLYIILLVYSRIITGRDLRILKEANIRLPNVARKFILKLISIGDLRSLNLKRKRLKKNNRKRPPLLTHN